MQADGEGVEIRGQVYRSRRRRFRTILFFDVRLGCRAAEPSPHTRLANCSSVKAREELLDELHLQERGGVACTVKAGAIFTEESVQRMRAGLHCGDEVIVRGIVEARREDGSVEKLLCTSVDVATAWSTVHPAGALFLWPSSQQPKGAPSRGKEEAAATADGGDNALQCARVSASQDAGQSASGEATGEMVAVWAGKVCKGWINTGQCGIAQCARLHELPQGWPLGRARQEWIRLRLQRRNAGEGAVKPKCQRAEVFCSWLEGKFGEGLLRRGVLDVAGGKGDVSFELAVKRGYRSVVVDPRPVKLSKPQFKYFKQRAKRRRKAAALQGLPPPLAAADQRPVDQLQCLFDGPFLEQHGQLVADVGVIVGMHPDEATEPLVDHALQAGKPFAVVPCCVFAAQNPGRRLRDGTPVHSYEEFVAYLQEKAPGRIRTDTLPFAGRNVVLYGIPPSEH